MSMKATKKMRGFMCHSPAATAVCMIGDPHSVIAPRRPDRLSAEHARLMNNAKYVQLAYANNNRRSSLSSSRNTLAMSLKKKEGDSDDAVHFEREKKKKAPQPPYSLPPSSSDNVFQVVVMRVSLHCQGCAGKVKKHLSKMEGVTSFSIELETKRVTVMGNVSPAGVLESISKVKKAEFWPCT